MTALAIVLLCALAAQHYLHSRERERLLDRIQAPQTVVTRMVADDAELLPAVAPDSDADYWTSRGLD